MVENKSLFVDAICARSGYVTHAQRSLKDFRWTNGVAKIVSMCVCVCVCVCFDILFNCVCLD